MEAGKWKYDPIKKTVTILQNGEYQLGNEDNWVTVVVQVGGQDVSKDVSEESGIEIK